MMSDNTDNQASPETTPPAVPADKHGLLSTKTIRTAVAGVLMGMANIIPGVSGGTMILALGLYEEFIDSVADITALRLSMKRILFLGILGFFAVVSIVVLSRVILELLFLYSSLMFALFIGLTLGGTPMLVRMIGRFKWSSAIAAIVAFALMAVVAFALQRASMPRNTGMDLASGVVGATTMVLPGISGSYMLLILDQYDRVVGAVSSLKDFDMAAIKILIPVGIGVVIGIVGLSNLLKLLLHKYEKATLGFLLGMLLGSVLGLWPFGRAPTEKILEKQSDTELVTYAQEKGIAGIDGLEKEQLVHHILTNWESRTAPTYATSEVIGAAIMLVIGFLTTILLGRIGGSKDKGQQTPEAQPG